MHIPNAVLTPCVYVAPVEEMSKFVRPVDVDADGDGEPGSHTEDNVLDAWLAIEAQDVPCWCAGRGSSAVSHPVGDSCAHVSSV